MGRPSWDPTPVQLDQAEKLAGYGLPTAQIANVLGCSEATLKRKCKAALAAGVARANMETAETLHRMANGRPAQYDGQGKLVRAELVPSERVAIFLGKVRLGMKETQVHEVGGVKDEKGRRGPIQFQLLPAEAGVRVDRKASGGAGPTK